MNDEDPYYVVASTTIIPGKYLGWREGVKEWWSDNINTKYNLSNQYLNLYDFSPSNRQKGGLSIAVTLSIPPGFSITWVYGDNGIVYVEPRGLTGDDIAEWFHDLDSGFWSIYPEGVDWPVEVEPGFSFTAVEGSESVQYWEITGVWSRPGYKGRPIDLFQGTLVIELHLRS